MAKLIRSKLEGGPKDLDNSFVEVEEGAPYCEFEVDGVINIYLHSPGPWSIPIFHYMGYRAFNLDEENPSTLDD